VIECGLGSHKTVISFEFERIFHLGCLIRENAAKSPSPSLARHPETLADLARTPAVSGGFCAALPAGSFKLLSSRKLKPAYQAVFVDCDRHQFGTQTLELRQSLAEALPGLLPCRRFQLADSGLKCG
jgi:hypothetical protein